MTHTIAEKLAQRIIDDWYDDDENHLKEETDGLKLARLVKNRTSNRKGRKMTVKQNGEQRKIQEINAALLEACKSLIDCIGKDGYFPQAGKTITDNLRAAIAAAEGK